MTSFAENRTGCAGAPDTGGDEALVAEWLARHRDAMVRAGRSFEDAVTRAQDIAQEAAVIAWRKRKLAPGIRHPRAWLVAITRTVGLRVHAKRSRRRPHDEALVTDPPAWLDAGDPTAEWQLQTTRREWLDRVVSLADRLPPSQREVVRCKLLEGMDNRAVAEKLGISVTTVRVHLCRAVARLRQLLDLKCE